VKELCPLSCGQCSNENNGLGFQLQSNDADETNEDDTGKENDEDAEEDIKTCELNNKDRHPVKTMCSEWKSYGFCERYRSVRNYSCKKTCCYFTG